MRIQYDEQLLAIDVIVDKPDTTYWYERHIELTPEEVETIRKIDESGLLKKIEGAITNLNKKCLQSQTEN